MNPFEDRLYSRVLVVGGLAQSLINFRGPFIKSLRNAGVEVYAAAPELTSNADVVNVLNKWGVICRDVPLRRAGINPFSDLCGLISLYCLIRKVSPDAVLGYTIKPVIYGMLAAWVAHVPHRFALVTGLGYAFTGEARGKRRFIRYVVRRFYSLGLAKAERVMFQNHDDEALFRQLRLMSEDMLSTVVNGSGVDLVHFNKTPLPGEPLSFLLIARLLGDKGVREYVAAARQLREKYQGVVFRLVGDIDDNPDSVRTEEIASWQRDGAIEYLGRLEDVRQAIADCSVYVLPSYREGTPRTVLEAMAMGRAIITTDAPGCRETVVNGDNGFLVPVRSVQGLVVAMEQFIEEPKLTIRMGERSRQIAEEKYDVHKVNRAMLEAMGISSLC